MHPDLATPSTDALARIARRLPKTCLWRSPAGRYCEKPHGHTGSHRCVMFSRDEARRVAELRA